MTLVVYIDERKSNAGLFKMPRKDFYILKDTGYFNRLLAIRDEALELLSRTEDIAQKLKSVPFVVPSFYKKTEDFLQSVAQSELFRYSDLDKIKLPNYSQLVNGDYTLTFVRHNCPIEIFNEFRNQRFRELKNGYHELVGEHAEFSDICRAYKTYSADNYTSGVYRRILSQRQLYEFCVSAFGEPSDSQTFLHIRIFLFESDVEEFDKEHEELRPKIEIR